MGSVCSNVPAGCRVGERLHFRIGTIAVFRLRREGRTFAASWKKSSCGSGFVSVLDSAFALNNRGIRGCFLFPRRMIWFSSLFRRGRCVRFRCAESALHSPTNRVGRNQRRYTVFDGIRSGRRHPLHRPACPVPGGSCRRFSFPGWNAVRNGTGVGFRTAEGQLQFGFGFFETDAARPFDEDRPVADGMTGQMGAQRVDVGEDGETTRPGCREVGPH